MFSTPPNSNRQCICSAEQSREEAAVWSVRRSVCNISHSPTLRPRSLWSLPKLLQRLRGRHFSWGALQHFLWRNVSYWWVGRGRVARYVTEHFRSVLNHSHRQMDTSSVRVIILVIVHLGLSLTVWLSAGNVHVYTNQGASYSQFYQPRRRRAYERREEVVEENQSQVSDSLNIRTIPW